MKELDPIYWFQETYLSHKEKTKAQSEGKELILQENGIQRKVSVTVFISDKIDFEI